MENERPHTDSPDCTCDKCEEARVKKMLEGLGFTVSKVHGTDRINPWKKEGDE